MGKAEYGTPKYVAKQMKARGLQRLRWYCQVCSKQCRDENGYKCHLLAPSHIAKAKDAMDSNKEAEFSKMFKHDFVYLLRISHGEKTIKANRFYNEYIQDKDHVHMSATRWTHLTQFIRALAREGIIRLDESPADGPEISWIDPIARETIKDRESRHVDEAAQVPKLEEKVLQRQLNATRSVPEPAASALEPGQDVRVSTGFSLRRDKRNGRKATPLKHL